MSVELQVSVGLAGAFVLGLRHGLDPDHIAAVDAMTYRSLNERPELAPWAGTLFALGHGGVVIVIAVVVGALGAHVSIPSFLTRLLEWTPVALLVVLGTLNLRALLREGDYRPAPLRLGIVPAFLRNSGHPLAMVAVGVVLGLVFDTASQAAAWGYAASVQGGAWGAFGVGLAFTLGMLVTDTCDARLMCRFLRDASTKSAGTYRRFIGWFTVALSFGMAFYSVVIALNPRFELPDGWLTALGFALVIVVASGVVWLNWPKPVRAASKLG
jgi:high-affinity nickel-transport protein